MATSNPYTTPSAAGIDTANQEFYHPKVFSLSGRIGRLRYLAYGMLLALITYGIFGLLAVLGLFSLDGSSSGAMAGISVILMIIVGIAMIVFSFGFAIRRLNDMDTSGWMSLLMLIPLVNLILMLVIIFAPGTPTANKYGPPPGPNSVLVIIGGLMYPVFFVIGILAAIALPAYQGYTERAQGYETQQFD